jgi:hypothetical protein
VARRRIQAPLGIRQNERITVTYHGGLADIPDTAVVGKQVRVTEFLIHRVSSGTVVEGWIEFDQLGLWQQLGAIPSLGQDQR